MLSQCHIRPVHLGIIVRNRNAIVECFQRMRKGRLILTMGKHEVIPFFRLRSDVREHLFVGVDDDGFG